MESRTEIDPTKFCLALYEKVKDKEKEGELTAGDLVKAVKEIAAASEANLGGVGKQATRVTKLLSRVLREKDKVNETHVLQELATIYKTASQQGASQADATSLAAMGERFSTLKGLGDPKTVRIAKEKFAALATSFPKGTKTGEAPEVRKVSLGTGIAIEIRNWIQEIREKCQQYRLEPSFLDTLKAIEQSCKKMAQQEVSLDDTLRIISDISSEISKMTQNIDSDILEALKFSLDELGKRLGLWRKKIIQIMDQKNPTIQ